MVALWLSLPALQEPVRVERLAYAKWTGCWRISNGRIEVVVVPQVGRVLRLARIGGPNLLWENPALVEGRSAVAPGEWANYGGDKLWPSPQSWGWPPDPKLDGSMHRSKAIANGVWMASQPAARDGVRFERSITLEPGADVVFFRQRMIATGPKPVRWAVWQVTQLNDPSEILMELPTDPASWIPMGDPPQRSVDANLRLEGRWLRITRHPEQSFKVGSALRNGTLWAKTASGWLEMRALLRPPFGTFPDQGAGLQVYCNADPDRYVELEVTGFLSELQPGEASELEVRWRLADQPKL
ncbi:MAG: DUF4380 domain-containing protein [Fimbriimonadales bacterium]|nr:DUF4380 domain-containing protein [Fimbriimonadales bacterium]